MAAEEIPHKALPASALRRLEQLKEPPPPGMTDTDLVQQSIERYCVIHGRDEDLEKLFGTNST